MITERDILEAIEECQSTPNPNANTCIRLAAFYTILDHLHADSGEIERVSYSYSSGDDFTEQTADEWVEMMDNTDGTMGAHWSKSQVQSIMRQRNSTLPFADMYAVMNSLYSDYYKVARKHGVNTLEFFFDLADAWLKDDDAVSDKARSYFENIVKH